MQWGGEIVRLHVKGGFEVFPRESRRTFLGSEDGLEERGKRSSIEGKKKEAFLHRRAAKEGRGYGRSDREGSPSPQRLFQKKPCFGRLLEIKNGMKRKRGGGEFALSVG